MVKIIKDLLSFLNHIEPRRGGGNLQARIEVDRGKADPWGIVNIIFENIKSLII